MMERTGQGEKLQHPLLHSPHLPPCGAWSLCELVVLGFFHSPSPLVSPSPCIFLFTFPFPFPFSFPFAFPTTTWTHTLEA